MEPEFHCNHAFRKGEKSVKSYIYAMAKQIKKKAPKEASNIFHNIMAASVKGNPRPLKQAPKKKTNG